MKRTLSIFFLAASTSFVFTVCAQDFIRSLENHEGNFYEIKKIANDYFNYKSSLKNSGYKQYKRIEWFFEDRVYPSGDMSLLNGSTLLEEITDFNNKYSSSKSSLNRWAPVNIKKYDNVDGHWSPGVGRMDRVVVDPTDENIIYTGAPTGGLWKSVDGGLNWETKTDNLPSIGICGIAINPLNSNIIYIATGDGDGGGTYSSGIFRSDDAGETWKPTSLAFNVADNIQGKKLIIHPFNPEILMFTSSSGIYKTTDSGNSWVLIESGSFDDIEFKQDDPSIVYATKEDAFYRSEDSGTSFEKVEINASGRIIIGLTKAAPSYVYLACGNEGIYFSNDEGKSFIHRGEHPFEKGLKWYMWGFAVSQSNPNILHIGNMISYKSVNGGLSWDHKTTEWLWENTTGYTHCDFHEMKYFGNTLYVCTDGGLAKSYDDGDSWVICFDGLETTQIYNIAVCKSDISRLMFGSQDNGVYYNNGTEWWGWLGADGMDVLYDYNDPSTRYATIQNGELYCSNHSISQAGRGGWVTPIAIHPTDNNTLYIATDVVRKSVNGMASWTTIGDIGSGYKKALAIAESNPDYIYVSEGSKIWKTSNGGAYWADISFGLPNRVITRIAVHPSDPSKVAISFSGYLPGEKVYYSDNGGLNWINYSRNLPNLPANAVVFDNNSDNSLYVGMDVGVFYTDNNLALWESYNDGLPNSIITDLEMNWDNKLLFAGTYGRGMWKVSTRSPGVTEIPGAATEPKPENQTTSVSKLVKLEWKPGSQTEYHKVYFGSENPPPFIENITTNVYDPRTLESNTTYYWQINEINKLGSRQSEIWSFTTNAYCTARGNEGTTSDYITRVETAEMDNSSAMGYYQDFSNISTNVSMGKEYSIDVTLAYHWSKDTVAVWIDWDDNSVFSYEERVDMSVLNASHISTGNYIVPDNITPGPKKLRVRNSYNVSPAPCGDFSGEVEDYTLNVIEENELLPGKASFPYPPDGSVKLPPDQEIRWKAGVGSETHNLYFGTDQIPSGDQFVFTLADTTFNCGDLQRATTYYWKVDEENSFGISEGSVWSFTTDAYCAAISEPKAEGTFISRLCIAEIDYSTQYNEYLLTESQYAELIIDSCYIAKVFIDNQVDGMAVLLWSDWNCNNAFEANELTVIDNFDAEGQGSCEIKVPESALPGITRMRVRLLPEEIDDPCNSYKGETEDYIVLVERELRPPEKASCPLPVDNIQYISTKNVNLSWIPGKRVQKHDIYFGASNPPPFAKSDTTAVYTTELLLENTDYYWRVDEENSAGITTGTTWHFKTFNSAECNPLKIDFGSNTSPVQSEFHAYQANNNLLASFTSQTYGALGNNITLVPSWATDATNESVMVIDRGVDDNSNSPDILRDWIGTDRSVPGNPFTIKINGLPIGEYIWKSYHHDPHDQSGLFTVTVSDSTGITISNNIEISNGGLSIQDVATFETTIKSNGSYISLTFDKLDEEEPETTYFVINGFMLEKSGVVGIEDSEINPDVLKVYPNPASDLLCVEFYGYGKYPVTIFNQLGVMVYNEMHNGNNVKEISLIDFESGIYTVVLFKRGRLITRNFIRK